MRGFYRCCIWMVLLLVSVLIGTGCTNRNVKPALMPAPTSSPESVATSTLVPPPSPEAVATSTLVPTPSPEAAATPTLAATRAPEAVATPASVATASPVSQSQAGMLYEDDFTDPSSGWPDELEFDNYYIGYHEPEWYHVEVHEPNDRALAFLPDRSFDDVSVESKMVFADELSSESGDFRYGLVVRRSGNRFYAFTISPRTQTWSVLKSSSTGLEILDQGPDDSIEDLRDPVTLRVDTVGPALSFFINGHAVSQVSDADYASGAVGFLVETFDSPRTHIHFDSLTIRKAEAPPTETTASCTELAVNGDFETDEGWTIANTPHQARYTSALARTGERSMQLGIIDPKENIYSYSSVEQRFRVPVGTVATLRFWYHMLDEGGNGDYGYFLIRPDGGSWRFMHTVTNATGDWTMFQVDVSQYAGQSFTVNLGTRNDGPQDSAMAVMYVDRFSLQSCVP